MKKKINEIFLFRGKMRQRRTWIAAVEFCFVFFHKQMFKKIFIKCIRWVQNPRKMN